MKRRWIIRSFPLRLIGTLLVSLGLFALLAIHTILVPGRRAVTVVHDTQGNPVHDDKGNFVLVINPYYVQYEQQQRHHSLIAAAIVTTGSLLLLADFYRRNRTAR